VKETYCFEVGRFESCTDSLFLRFRKESYLRFDPQRRRSDIRLAMQIDSRSPQFTSLDRKKRCRSIIDEMLFLMITLPSVTASTCVHDNGSVYSPERLQKKDHKKRGLWKGFRFCFQFF